MSISQQLPTHLTHDAFGEVNVTRGSESTEVELTLLMTPKLKGAQTALALDGSNSMRSAYGRALLPLRAELLERLKAEDLLTQISRDGVAGYRPTDEGLTLLREERELDYSENLVEEPAQQLGAFLAKGLDADKGTLLLYWGCGDGQELEELGTFRASEFKRRSIVGPARFGGGSQLAPALRLLTERFRQAPFSFFVFITDGHLEDFDEVVALTRRLCQEISRGERPPMKLILIGVGDEIDRAQLSALDDLESELDLWDYKIAEELRDLRDIFAEMGDGGSFVAPEGKIYDDQGQLLQQLQSGVPSRLRFHLPALAKGFSLELNGFLLEQPLPL